MLDRHDPKFDNSPCYDCQVPSMCCEVACQKLALWDKDNPGHATAVEFAAQKAAEEGKTLSDAWKKQSWQADIAAYWRNEDYKAKARARSQAWYQAHKEQAKAYARAYHQRKKAERMAAEK